LSVSEVIDWQPNENTLQPILVIPVALLDTGFYWWICLSLFRTISQLSSRNQTLKLQMYKSLFNTLVTAVLMSAVVTLLNMVVALGWERDDLWETNWVWNAYWHIQYFVILLVVAIIWLPTENNTRYACSDVSEIDEDGDEGEAVSLQPLHVMGLGDIVKRKREDEKWREGVNSSDITVSVSMGLLGEDENEPHKME